MKKFGMIVLAAALAFAMVGTAVAADVGGGFSASANFRVRGRMDQFDVAGDDSAAMYLDTRGRFTFGYAAEDYKAVLQLEIGDAMWGTNYGLAGDNFGEDQRGAIKVKHLYVTGPAGPVALTVGLQALKLGNGLFYGDDDWAIKGVYAIPTGGNLIFAYMKEMEGDSIGQLDIDGTRTLGDDVTGIVVIYSGEASGWAFQPFLAYLMIGEAVGDGSGYAIGIPVSGPAGPVSIAAEFDYVGGSQDTPADPEDETIGGYALWAKATYPLAQANAFLELGYGSGDDPGTLDKNEGFLPMAEDFTYDIVLEDAAIAGVDSLNDRLYVKVGGDYQQSEQLTLSGAFIYNMAVQKDNWGDETALGTELDLAATYKVTGSTTLAAKLGYLMPGAALESALGDNGGIYRAEWSLTYNF